MDNTVSSDIINGLTEFGKSLLADPDKEYIVSHVKNGVRVRERMKVSAIRAMMEEKRERVQARDGDGEVPAGRPAGGD